MKLKTLALALPVTLLLALSLRAAPQPPVIPDDATWAISINVERLLASPLGKIVKDEVAKPEHAPKIAAVEAMFSVNLMTDIQTLTAYGPSEKEDLAVLVVGGKFNVEKLTTILRAADSFTEKKVDGRSILSWVDKKQGNKRTYGCFFSPEQVVLSASEASLKGALAAMGQNKGGKLSNEVGKNAAGLGVYAVARNVQKMLAKRPAGTAMLKDISDIEASMDVGSENTTLSVGLVMVGKEEAQQMQKVGDGILALASLNAEANPAAAQLASQIKVTLSDLTLKASMQVANATILEAVKKAQENKAREQQP